ncbi:MAG: hypothetical protein CMC77_02360 [Flavobacteriaceae bacterium]|jgi:hypothetical protein|nr:hypothetical protein [Flavobacteriaceae bacterium]|tara:strand:- start:49 stop:573 length:525 start_codon:yes stop_codon:yes gene_type:complete
MKLLFTILSLISTSLIFSQSLFEKYEDMDNVSSVVVNQKMFGMLAEMKVKTNDPETDAFLDQIKTLNNLTVFSTKDTSVSDAISADVNTYVKASKLEELMRVKDGDQNIKFYVQSGRDEFHVSELLMLVRGRLSSDETVLLSLNGDIDLRTLAVLTDQLNVPGGKQLEKASKTE